MRTSSGRQALCALFYVVLVVVLAACLVPFVKDVLPGRVATQVAHNSEGYLIALIVAPWIQFVRGRLAGRRIEWPVTVAVAVLCLVVGILLIVSDLPSRIRTLNEGFLAAGLLLPYLQLRRPLARALPFVVVVVAALVAIVFNHNSEITDLAEVWGALVLFPLSLDLVDRGILDPTARNRRGLRYGWYAVLVVVPVACSVLDASAKVTGTLNQVVHYVARCNEDFIAALLVSLCLAVILGWTGRRKTRAVASDGEAVAATR